MGIIYRGEHPRIGKRVAIKVLHSRYAADPDVVRRFLEEARATNRIVHPNILPVFAFGDLPDGRPYLIMDLFEGGDLRRLLDRDRPLADGTAAAILEQLCGALGAAHEAGIVHRDLKPENVLVGEDAEGRPRAYLTDFGIAKVFKGNDGNIPTTREGMAVGTPRSMAPEQFEERPVLGPPTDVYALGLLMHEIFSGVWPWEANTVLEHAIAHKQAPPRIDPRLEEHRPSLAQLIRDCLEKVPARRPQSTREVASRLRDALTNPSDPSLPTTTGSRHARGLVTVLTLATIAGGVLILALR
jgi:serine/threonine-protein kinase